LHPGEYRSIRLADAVENYTSFPNMRSQLYQLAISRSRAIAYAATITDSSTREL